MKIYWYWPFVRDEELATGEALCAAGHSVYLHTIAGRVTHHQAPDRFTVDASVPAVASKAEGTARWLASRATTYPMRARVRKHAVRRGDFDIAHVIYLNYFTDWLSLPSLSRDTPLVCTVHDVVPHQRRVPERIQRALLARQYQAASTIVVHHPTVGEQLTAEFGVDAARIHFVPWAVPVVPAREFAADRPTFEILMFGTMRRNKGIDVMLDAFRQITDPRFRLTIAGRGFADIEALVAEAGARDPRIRAEIGFISEDRKRELYSGADVVALPYTSFSSQSAVLHDAYAHHVPVVVSEVGALGDSVRHDATGVVIPPNDSQALAGTLIDLEANAVGRSAYGEGAKVVAEARTPAIVADQITRLYNICLNPGAKL